MLMSKYGNASGWASAQNNRLGSWGFNAAGMYSYAFMNPPNRPSGALPVEDVFPVSGHAKRDDNGFYHCKSINYSYGSMVCSSSFYVPSSGGELDVFDGTCDSGGGVQGAFSADVSSNYNCTSCGSPPKSAIMFITTEEGDDVYGLNNSGHEDLGYITAAHNPVQAVSPNSPSYNYPDATLDAKIALRDYLAAEYGCTGTPVSGGDELYGSSSYCGSSNASSALAALNSAWHTSYTTWSTSDTYGEAGIKVGGGNSICTASGSPYACCTGSGAGTCSAYGSYGTGSGFLDENGQHILASAYRSNCNLNGGVIPGNSWSTYSQIETDLHNFITYFAQTYAQKLSTAWAQASVKPHPPVFVPLYTGPSYVYTAIAPYFDGFWVGPKVVSGSQSLSDLQRIIAAASVSGGKSMPVIIADYSSANPDSPFSSSSTYGNPEYSTQGARGAGMVSFWQNALHQTDANGNYVVVGLEHWSFYDSDSEGTNYGLVTSDHDNPYDGSADTVNGEPANYGDAITAIRKFLVTKTCGGPAASGSPP